MQAHIINLLSNVIHVSLRIKVLNDLEFDIQSFSQPDSVLEQFYGLQSEGNALLVAKIFKNRWGDIILCRELSQRYGRFMTIMDVLDDEAFLDYEEFILIAKTFNDLGFKRALYCDQYELAKLYCEDPNYTLSDIYH